MSRPSWQQYWLDMASLVATRATCTRLKVGCVLVRDNRLLAAGYNGSLAGEPHCEDVGCLVADGRCVRTNHAEANAVADAARRGVSLQGATGFVTHAPCIVCTKLLVSAGASRILFQFDYGTPHAFVRFTEKT